MIEAKTTNIVLNVGTLGDLVVEPTYRLGLHLNERERANVLPYIDAFLICVTFASALPASPNRILVALFASVMFAVAFSLTNFYAIYRQWNVGQVLYECVKGCSLGLLFIAGLNYILPAPSFAPAAVLPSVCISLAALAGWRLSLFEQFSSVTPKRTVVVGTSAESLHLAKAIQLHPVPAYKVVGITDVGGTFKGSGTFELPFLGAAESLPALTRSLALDAILLDSSAQSSPAIESAVLDCLNQGIDVQSSLDVYEQLTASVPINYIDHSWFMSAKVGDRKPYLLAKRLIDITLGLLGLAFTALITPLLFVAIKLWGDKGPVFYHQVRVGFKGKLFKIYKIRTMHVDAESNGPVWASQKDDRVTRLGRLLRQTRLDEIPQFWNVLKGEMSMVGPRPERPEFVRMLAQNIPFYDSRHLVLPGLTGWAQVMAPYGASVEDTAEKLRFDLFYLKSRSFFFDLRILLMTVRVMVNKIGAR